MNKQTKNTQTNTQKATCTTKLSSTYPVLKPSNKTNKQKSMTRQKILPYFGFYILQPIKPLIHYVTAKVYFTCGKLRFEDPLPI